MSIKRVGVIGGGQLASMMADEAKGLDIDLVIQTPSQDDPAVASAKEVIIAPIDDATATAELATRCQVITFENEFINLAALQQLANQGVCFHPSLASLSPLLDKYEQRAYLQSLGLPVPQFSAFSCGEPLPPSFSFPVVIKARRHGYDGQGTFIVKDLDSLKDICASRPDVPLMLEEYIPFTQELAIIAARGVTGEVVIYPVVETQQENQVCHRVMVPADISLEISLQVEAIARTLLEKLEYVGILAIELFLTQDNRVLVNELAPRTHNSGHYTLDACFTSQFANQLRAVTGLPLGSSALKYPGALMVNLLGYEHSHCEYEEIRAKLAAVPHSLVWWYGKTESRPGRKLGHVTVVAPKASPKLLAGLEQTAQKIESIWYI